MYEDYDEEFGEVTEPTSTNKKVSIELPTPHSGQQQVLDSNARFKVLLCGRRWGKSLVAQIIAVNAMLKGQKVAYVTPKFRLGKKFFRDILKIFPQNIVQINNQSDLIIELINGGSLSFFSGSELEDFRGNQFHKLVVDEAAHIPDLERAWRGAMRATLSDFDGEALFISTPLGMNYFYALYKSGLEKENGWQSWHFPSNTNPYFSKEEFELLKHTEDEATFAQEYLAEPMADGNNPFGIENIKMNIVSELSTEPTIIYSCDLAAVRDFTVIIGVDLNNHISYFDRFRLDWETTFNRIQLLPKDVLKVVDATGVGDVMFSRLQQTSENVRGFKFTAQSKPAIINQLINDVQKGTIKYNEIIAKEMMVYQQNRTSTGYIKYEAQSGFHDDCVAALAMANHFRHEAWASRNWKLYTI